MLLSRLSLIARLAEGDHRLVAGQLEVVRVLGDDFGGEVDDVTTVVPILGSRSTVGGRGDRLPEPIHLHPTVVDVELPRHLRPGGSQHPRQRISDGGPAG